MAIGGLVAALLVPAIASAQAKAPAKAPTKAPAKAQASAPVLGRKELVRLDALLAAGDAPGADALLQSLAPELARDDRLAFDTIYVLVGRGRFDAAREQWNGLAPRVQKRLQAAAAGSAEGRVLAGEAMFTQGLLTAGGGDPANRKDALKLLQDADGLGFPPLDSPLMLLAGGCLLELQEYDLAIGAYREFLKAQPGNTEARAALGTALYARGRATDARKELEEVVRIAPDTPHANYTLGAVLFDLKEYAEARARIERELARDARCGPCFSKLAHLAYLDGDDGKCREWLAKSFALDPAELEAHLVAGMLALRSGEYASAIEHLSVVTERSPGFATARLQLSNAYRRAGEPEKAREQLEIYQRLIKEQKDRENGVRGGQ